MCLSCIFTGFHAPCTVDFSSFLTFVGPRIIGLLCFSMVLHPCIMDISCFLVFFRLRIKDSSCFLVDFWAVGLKFTRFTCKLRCVRFVQSLQFFCVVCLSCIFTVFHASCTIDFSSFLIFVGLHIIGLLCFPAFLHLRIMDFSSFLVCFPSAYYRLLVVFHWLLRCSSWNYEIRA